MNLKAIKTRKSKIKKTTEVKVSNEQTVDKDETQNIFDMGGIPQRNLKKNLGCG